MGRGVAGHLHQIRIKSEEVIALRSIRCHARDKNPGLQRRHRQRSSMTSEEGVRHFMCIIAIINLRGNNCQKLLNYSFWTNFV